MTLKREYTNTHEWDILHRAFLPYNVRRISGDTFILLNRNYWPVGMTQNRWYDYAACTDQHVRMNITQKQVTALTADFREHQIKPYSVDNFYLFNDGCPPWNSAKDFAAYSKRLAKLMKRLSRSELARKD